jgi:uncharacterized protein (UPF0303 family)
MVNDTLIAGLLEQERRLQFSAFDAETAWSLGKRLRQAAQDRGQTIAFEIWCNGLVLLHHAMTGAKPDNANWIRRKRNLVLHVFGSSYRVAVQMRLRGSTLEQALGLSAADYVAAGGGFPIQVAGAGCIGALVVSGLTSRADHDLAVEALADTLNVSVSECALPLE